MVRREEQGNPGKGGKGCRRAAGHLCGRVLGIHGGDG